MRQRAVDALARWDAVRGGEAASVRAAVRLSRPSSASGGPEQDILYGTSVVADAR
jgi:hypothetical protein